MIRVGIAGLGFMGMIHYLAYQKLKGVKVAAMCEMDRARLAGDWRSIKGNFGPAGTMMDLSGIAKYERLEAMLADGKLDMIDICLPPAGARGRGDRCARSGQARILRKADRAVAGGCRAGWSRRPPKPGSN